MKTLLVEAQLKKFSRVKDGAVSLSFTTAREMTIDEFSLVDQYYQNNGWLVFKLDEIGVEDIPEENTKIKGQKSRSQQLRLKIFALHMKKGGDKSNFTPFYERMMDRIDLAVQDELDQLED